MDGKRLVWAEAGRQGLHSQGLLRDLNDMQFERIQAPEPTGSGRPRAAPRR